MYRYRMFAEVKYGHFAEFVEVLEEINALSVAAKIKPAVAWVPTVGQGNSIVLETEYADLTEFQKDQQVYYGNADIMKLTRKISELVVQGSNRDELLEPAPHLA